MTFVIPTRTTRAVSWTPSIGGHLNRERARAATLADAVPVEESFARPTCMAQGATVTCEHGRRPAWPARCEIHSVDHDGGEPTVGVSVRRSRQAGASPVRTSTAVNKKAAG
jgi:hypothetical protein